MTQASTPPAAQAPTPQVMLAPQTMLTQAEALELLGVSAQTLRRYARSGRLPVHYEKGKTRPRPLYPAVEIRALREELEAAQVRRKARASRPPRSPIVAFRVDGYHLAKLTEDGARYGLTPGEYARRLVAEGIEGELQRRVEELEKTVGELRADLAEAVAVVLEYAGGQFTKVSQGQPVQGMSKEDVAQWIEANLSR